MIKYEPQKPIVVEEWLQLDEQEKINLVEQAHQEEEPPEAGAEAHALIHVLVENQIAENTPSVRKTLRRLMNEGLDRHDAIHAIAIVLSTYTSHLLDGGEFSQREYSSRLKAMTAQVWFELAEFDEEEIVKRAK